MWPMNQAFFGAKILASNLPRPGEKGTYTEDMFRSDYPGFFKADDGTSLVPASMLEILLEQTNEEILPSRWGTSWRRAAGLHLAHFSSLYLETYQPGSETPKQAVAGAQATGVVKTATMGDTSISYDNSAITAATEKWGSWNTTKYGQQLVTMMRVVGMGGMWTG